MGKSGIGFLLTLICPLGVMKMFSDDTLHKLKLFNLEEMVESA